MNNRRIFNNAIWIVGCKIFRALLGLIVTMLSARYLGPSGYGIINYAASIVTFVVPVMQLGLNSTLVQELLTSPDREGEVMGTSIAMSLVSGLCGCYEPGGADHGTGVRVVQHSADFSGAGADPVLVPRQTPF